jgi:4-amino-4-deoxy-L-arabinose transferase-like glycosyltransferase
MENMKTLSGNRFYDFFIISVLFIFSMLIRIYNYADLSVQPDEITYSSYAYSILSHNWAWPPEFMGANPPLLPYILAIATYLFEGGLDVFRLVSIFFGSLSVCVIYFLGKSLYNRRVGILAATLLCFCSYHILFSRTVMLEAIWIFLAYLSLYYFWKSYNEENGIKYALLSGVFLGLALDTKFNALLLYISFALFILWTKKRGWLLGWKYLIEKKYLLLVFVSLLVFSPVFIDLCIHGANPFYWHLVGRYQTQFVGYKTVSEFGILTLLQHGFDNYVDMIINGSSIATQSISWLPAFYLAASFLLLTTILYFLYLSLKSEPQPSGCFLMITFFAFNAFIALFATRFQYYLLWGLPVFFIMLSYLIVNFIESIILRIANKESRLSLKALARIFVLALAFIFVFSYIIVGIMVPSVNEAPTVGYETQVINIKYTIQPGESIATDKGSMIDYYFDKYEIYAQEEHIFLLPIFKMIHGRQRVNLEMLENAKPRYIITSVYLFSAYTTSYDKKMIEKDYDLISNENDVLLYEREKN